MPRVVVVGSINVDLVVVGERLPAAGETVAGGRFAYYGGGKSANQAVAAARLGADVVFVGAVGDATRWATKPSAELRAEGIDVSGAGTARRAHGRRADRRGRGGREPDRGRLGRQRRARRRRRCRPLEAACAATRRPAATAATPPPPANTPHAGARAARRAAARTRRPPPRASSCSATRSASDVVIAGARAAEAAGWPVVLNPAPARELPRRAARGAHAERVGGRAADRRGGPGSRRPGAGGVHRRGRADHAGCARRAAARTRRLSRVLLPATKVDVVDTTGAGDTVNGALAAELAAGRSLREAAGFACAPPRSRPRSPARAAACRARDAIVRERAAAPPRAAAGARTGAVGRLDRAAPVGRARRGARACRTGPRA